MKTPVTPVTAEDVCRGLGYVAEDVVCTLLNIEPPTLRNRLSIGTAPPSYKVGNRHLFKITELDAWIRARRVRKSA